ncbi:ssp5 [Symbiodinium natans]|uniref:Ssp5 protein n=1 Tax=Symbiodinium natans TaxID=878477 RepID=A0A812KGF4_9DINO|nr:ssp5 [Symbiodinium natans]
MLLGGEEARKFEVPSKAEVPLTKPSDEYVAALKSEFQAALARALDKASEEKAELQQELASAAAASQEYLRELARNQADMAQLKEAVARLEAKDLDKTAAKESCWAAEKAQLQHELASLAAASQDSAQELARNQAEVAELKEAVARLEVEARCWAAEKAELQRELASTTAASQEYLQQLAGSQAAVAELQEAVARLEAGAQDKTAAQESCWVAEKAELQRELASAAAIFQELARNQADVTELKEAVMRLEADAQDKAAAQESCWAAEKAQLQQDLARAAAAFEECSQELACNQAKVAELQEAVASLQAHVREQHIALLSLQTELHEPKAQVHEVAKKEELWDVSESSQCSPCSARASSSHDAVLPGAVQEIPQQPASSRRAPVITRWQDAGLWGRTKASLQDGRLGQASHGLERKDSLAKDMLRKYIERYGKIPDRADQLTKFAQNMQQCLPFAWARDVLAAA